MDTAVADPDKFEGLFKVVDNMTVLELSTFIKRFEERFGVVAQAVVTQSVVPAPTTESAVEVGEQTEFEVVLVNAGQTRINVIKLVKDLAGLGLKDAKDLVDAAPKAVRTGLSKADADKMAASLKEAGAEVEIR